jgi:hypothetical protein
MLIFYCSISFQAELSLVLWENQVEAGQLPLLIVSFLMLGGEHQTERVRIDV